MGQKDKENDKDTGFQVGSEDRYGIPKTVKPVLENEEHHRKRSWWQLMLKGIIEKKTRDLM